MQGRTLCLFVIGMSAYTLAFKGTSMEVLWDMRLLNNMSEDTRALCIKAKQWLILNEPLSMRYVIKTNERHPALWFSRVMSIVEEAIDNEEQEAIDLACLYVIHAQKGPIWQDPQKQYIGQTQEEP